VIRARSGPLESEVAVYQLLEDPAPGRFVLDEPEVPPEKEPTDPIPMSIRSPRIRASPLQASLPWGDSHHIL
jgi:hypothetical protein